MHPISRRWAILLPALFLGCGIAAYGLSMRSLSSSQLAAQANRAGLYASTLVQAVDRFAYLPLVLARDSRVLDLLAEPRSAGKAATVNAYLTEIAGAAQAADLFVMDENGLTLAASNHGQATSFVGQSYAFRPYFQDALRTGQGRFYGIGVTTGEAGYFLSQRIGPADGPLGVAVVKIALAGLERDWGSSGETVLLADSHGIVFLASHPELKFRAVDGLSAEDLMRVHASAQYKGVELPTAPLFRKAGEGGFELDAPPSVPSEQLAAAWPVSPHGWTIYALSDRRVLQRQATLNAGAAGLAALAAALAALFWLARRATTRALRLSRDRLERKVARRTQALVAANAKLKHEVEQRRSAEANLRETQDRLVQSSKLAALGHMSAAIAHEINQPLSALRTYVASTARLLEVDRRELAVGNLARMGDLIARMATITSDLKLFARNDPGELRPVQVQASIRRALDLLRERIDAEEVSVRLEGGPAVARASETRLDQVLVNLVGNALDALRGQPVRCLTITTEASADEVRIAVADTGCGIRPEVRMRLFDPYVTTKEVGSGLGLGLSISDAIMRGFGGRISVASPEAGASFVLILAAATASPETRLEAVS